MALYLAAISPVLLYLLFLRLTWCSEQWLSPEYCEVVEWTEQRISSITAHFKDGPADQFVVELRECLVKSKSQQRLCLQYLIVSVAISGAVDECALSTLRGLCNGEDVAYLTELLNELAARNDCDTAARFILKNLETSQRFSSFRELVTGLMEKNWHAVERLIKRALAILEEDENQRDRYYILVSHLPIELQYEKINTGKVPMKKIEKMHSSRKFFSPLRGIFFLARCSQSPNPEIRGYIMDKVPRFKNFSPGPFPAQAAVPCPGGSFDADHYVWKIICTFLDTETLLLIWPLVCTSWNKSYSQILTCEMEIHKWYLRDLDYFGLSQIHTVLPWKYCLNGTNSTAYLGLCIASGALLEVVSEYDLDFVVRKYLLAVESGETPIPTISKESDLYESFLMLIEGARVFYSYTTMIFYKPPLVTDEQYERAIHHLTCGKRLVLKLPDSWIIDNVSRLYSVIGQDEDMVVDLIFQSVGSRQRLCIVLIILGQACGISEQTVNSIFATTRPFEKLIGPKLVDPRGYYNFIVESDLLSEITANGFMAPEFSHLVVSLIVYFKGDPSKVDKIVASTARLLSTIDDAILKHPRQQLGCGVLKVLDNSSKYSSADANFVRKILVRCGCLEESQI